MNMNIRGKKKPAGIKQRTLSTVLPYLLLILGGIGLLASFTLTYDKIQVLQDPGYSPTCSINPILSCGSVMNTEQSSLLGVPGSIFGIIGYTALVTIAVSMIAGGSFKRWLWVGMQIAATIGVGYMHYLFFQGVFRIGAICPYCFVVWMVTIPIFWYITLYNLRQRHIVIKDSIATFLQKHHGDILLVWYLLIFGILLNQFWFYWQTLI